MTDFRLEVGSIAQQVAVGRGASAVAAAGSGMLWVDPDSDVTDEVLAVLRSRGTTGLARAADAIDDESFEPVEALDP